MADTAKPRANSDAAGHGTVNVLPYPPALEFPYPQTSAGNQPPEPSAQPTANNVTTPGLLEQAQTSKVRPPGPSRNFLTDRPPQTQRRSFLGLKRGQTFAPQNRVFDAAFWESDDATTSDDEFSRKPDPGNAADMPVKRSESQPVTNDDVEEAYRSFAVGNEGYKVQGRVSKKDGRLKISLKDTANKGYLANSLAATLKHHLRAATGKVSADDAGPDTAASARPRLVHAGTTSTIESIQSMVSSVYSPGPIPKLNICIMVIGSRGDIQPFLRLGKILAEEYGHRVRIATHPAFREFIESESGLEFFSVGGDPAELMAFMVKNPGLIPKAKTIREGEVAKRRDAMYEMFKGFWRACVNTTDDEHDTTNLKMLGKRFPFVADAIIANPPSFAHVHCAERLGIPLHLMFTFPMTPTQQFPHPLANIKNSNVDHNYTNFMSYPLVDMMTWQGLGDLVNRFRVKTLDLEPISTLWAPGHLFRMRVPYSYLWSPALIPKPSDWGPEIEVSGFVFLNLADSFEPAKELVDFLEAGEPPIYIGFGSIVVDDPEKFTELIFEAISKAGVRALVSKGWGGLGDDKNTSKDVFMLGNTPHDWLFPRVSAVVHHGGAGSTAIGLKCGKPTMIVPFFGDQPFWGAMVAKSGAGAEAVPYKRLTADILADSIKKLLTPECQAKAKEVAAKIANEGDGAANAVNSFHRKLPLTGNHSMRCSILEDQVAVWWLKGTHVRLSSLAAEILVRKRKIRWSDLVLVRHYDWNDFEGPGEPVTGAGGAIIGTVTEAVQGIGGTPNRWSTILKRKEKRRETSKNVSSQEESGNNSHNDGEQNDRQILAKMRNKLHKDQKDGTMHKPDLPTSNIGEGRLKHELMKNKSSKGDPLMSVPSGEPDEESNAQSSDAPTPDSKTGKRDVAAAVAIGTGKGLAKTGSALVNAPIDISVALAQGFHNAPRLWGDDTVRTSKRVTGVKSGLEAARDEFAFGIYDGWKGLIQHPRQGLQQEGVLGLAKGVGKGIGGFILKDIAALAGLEAYPLKGLQKELRKGRHVADHIRRAHIIDGQKRANELSKEDALEAAEAVNKGWNIISDALQIKHEYQDSGLKGKLKLRRDRQKWKKNAVFENVEHMGRALEAQREGKDIEQEFAQHRRKVDKAENARSPQNATTSQKSAKQTKSPRPSSDSKRMSALPKFFRRTGAGEGDTDSDKHRASTEMAGEQTGTAVIDQAVASGNRKNSREEGKDASGGVEEKDGGGAADSTEEKKASGITDGAEETFAPQTADGKVEADGQVDSPPPTRDMLKPATTL